MKDFNEKHEAIIESYFSPIPGTNPKDKEIAPHFKRVTIIRMYQNVWIAGQDHLVCIYLNRETIIDLSEAIAEIERGEVDIFTDLSPF